MYLFGGIIFIAFPTSSKILYTDSDFSVTGTDIFSKFIENMRVHNSGVCALPSFHVIGTYSIFLIQRSSLSKKYSKNISKKTNISLLIFSSIFNVMVGMSTFMTHQHFILDFPSAILCCEIVYFIMLKLEKKPNITQRLFTNLNVALAFENAQNTTWGGNLCTKIMNLKHRTF
jgi:hypothetical protein